MKIQIASLAVLIALTAPVQAQTPATGAAKPKPAAATPLALAPGVKRGVMSPEGRTIAARIYGTPEPRIAQLQAELAALRADRTALIAATPIDLDRLEPMLRQEELLSTELRARSNDRLMLLLRQLPEADRAVALQTMANPVRPQSSAPAKPAN